MKRWALMSGALCANVVEQEAMPEVAGTWLDVTGLTVGPGHRWNGATWLSPAQQVPIEVTRAQAKIALSRADVTEAEVQALIDAMPEGQAKVEADIWWRESNTFQRDHALVATLGGLLGFDSDELDALFVTASTIKGA